MKYSSRFFLYAPLGVVAILAVVTGVHWWVAASALSTHLDALNGREAMPGMTVAFAAKRIGGFPFNLDVEFSQFSIAIHTANGPTRWRSEKFALHALTYGRDETVFEAAGRQRLEWSGGHSLDFQAGALHASAIRKKGALDRLDLDLIGFGSKSFTAQRLQLHARRDTGALLVVADGLAPCRVATIRYSTTVAKPEAFDYFLAGRQTWAGAVTAWRKAGGMIATDKSNPLAQLDAVEIPNPTAVAETLCP